MKINQEMVAQCTLFRGICPEELENMLNCLNIVERNFLSGETIFQAGQLITRIGILLSGKAQIVREEYDGSRTIITELKCGELFGEAFVCAVGEEKILPFTVLSVSESVVLLLDYKRVVTTCPSACPFHTKLIENMLAVLAEKNLLLNRRLGHLSKRSTREKLLSYLSEMAVSCGNAEFTIPFDRQELADYLCVERSAMSAALSKLQQEGLIAYRKNRFIMKSR